MREEYSFYRQESRFRCVVICHGANTQRSSAANQHNDRSNGLHTSMSSSPGTRVPLKKQGQEDPISGRMHSLCPLPSQEIRPQSSLDYRPPAPGAILHVQQASAGRREPTLRMGSTRGSGQARENGLHFRGWGVMPSSILDSSKAEFEGDGYASCKAMKDD